MKKRKEHILRKIMVVLLSAALVVGMVQGAFISVSAAEDHSVTASTTWQGNISSVSITGGSSADSAVVITVSGTVDVSGTITVASGYVKFTGSGTLKWSSAPTNAIVVKEGANAVFENVVLDGNSKTFSQSALMLYGNVTLGNGVTVQNFYSSGGSGSYAGYKGVIAVYNEGLLNIQDGATITGNQSKSGIIAIYQLDKGGGTSTAKVCMSGGTITGNTVDNQNMGVIWNWCGTLEISGGTVTAAGNEYAVLTQGNSGSYDAATMISGGTFTGETLGAVCAGKDSSNNSKITITGGTFKGNVAATVNYGTININGGSYQGSSYALQTNSGSLNVSGGEFLGGTAAYSGNVTTNTAKVIVGESRENVSNWDRSTNLNNYKYVAIGEISTPSPSDTQPPTGEIAIGENKWNSFLNTITFGHFFKGTQKVTVTAQDGEQESGVDKIYYYVSETSFADAEALAGVTWTEMASGSSFSIGPDTKSIIYVKITDKAGNVTIINSDGVVVYQDATKEALITYEKATKTDKCTDDTFTLNGNTVAAVKNEDKRLTAGTDYEVSQNTIIFKGIYLDTLEVGDYTLTVAYDPMGEVYTQGSSKGEAPAESKIRLKVIRHEGRVSIDQNYGGKTYDGKAVEAPSFEADSTGTATIEYKKADQTDDSYTLNAPTAAGAYVVRVTVAEDADYAEASATKSFKIYPKKLTSDMVKATTSYYYTGETIVPELTVTDGAIVLAAGKDYKLSGDTSKKEVGSYTLTLTGKDNYSGEVRVTYKITDSAPPTGTIRVAKNEWKSLIHTLTFGIFYKARQTVTITAADEGSGVAAVSYFLTSNATLIDQEALAALPDIKWTKFAHADGGSFMINPDQKYVIYVKITDQSGNVTFISSNGIVLDQTAPEIKGITNGKTYCSGVTFTVSDSIGLASVKIDGVDQGIGGNYNIAAGSEKATHTIEAADTAGNKTKYTVTINANGTHSFNNDDWKTTIAATCEEDGMESRTCTSCGFVETKSINKKGHDYASGTGDAHFIWSTEKDAAGVVTGYSARAYFVCKNDANHTKDLSSCTVAREVTKSATEENEGVVTYTATASYEGKPYTATKKTTLAKLTKIEDSAAPSSSNIYTSTSVADQAPATTINEGLDADLAKKLMTAAEEANYNDSNVATDVTVYLEVQNITGAVPSADTQKVQSEIADLITKNVNAGANVEVEAKAGNTTYLDLSMYKKVTTKKDNRVTSDTTTQITDTEKDIKITVAIPAGLPAVATGFKRGFHIIRVHGDTAEILPADHIEGDNALTFWTSKFSTYAISYVDVKETPVPSSPVPSSSGGGNIAIPATKITITSDSDKTTFTKTGETLQLTFEITPTNATDKKVTWSSSDPKVATVDENGKVTAVGDGTVTITAKTGNGKTADFTITVKIKPEKEDGKDDDAGNTGGSSGKITLDTTYRKLALRASASTKTTNVLKWNKVADADGYVIYGNRCNSKGKTYQMVKQAVIKNNATTTWTDKALTSGTYYKYYIKAYKLVDGKKVWLAKSKVVHVTTTGGKYGNAKSLKVNKTAVSLSKGKTFAIKAEQIIKSLTIRKHANIKYESSNSKIASVTGKGVIKANKKGTCYIYVYAQNGKYKRIKVTVK